MLSSTHSESHVLSRYRLFDRARVCTQSTSVSLSHSLHVAGSASKQVETGSRTRVNEAMCSTRILFLSGCSRDERRVVECCLETMSGVLAVFGVFFTRSNDEDGRKDKERSDLWDLLCAVQEQGLDHGRKGKTRYSYGTSPVVHFV